MVANVQFHPGPGLQPAPIGYIEASGRGRTRNQATQRKISSTADAYNCGHLSWMVAAKPKHQSYSAETVTRPFVFRDDRRSTLRGALFSKVLASFLLERRTAVGARLARGVAPCRRRFSFPATALTEGARPQPRKEMKDDAHAQ